MNNPIPDPFFGTQPWTDDNKGGLSPMLPRIDRTWSAIRELFGATHPGATAPFGMTAAVPFAFYRRSYKEGFPSGYDGENFYGFGHFAQSGTGTMRWYYNYLLVSPEIVNTLCPTRRRIVSEQAAPGHYVCELDDGIRCQSTASSRCLVHSFQFPEGKSGFLVIDAAHHFESEDQGWTPRERFPEKARIDLIDAHSGSGYLLMDGHPLYFYLETDTDCEWELFANGKVQTGSQLEFNEHCDDFGFRLSGLGAGSILHLNIGFSFISEAKARANLQSEMPTPQSPDGTKDGCTKEWQLHMDRIQVEGGRERDRQIFANCLHKALIKPAHGPHDENPFWSGSDTFTDLATVWDMCSTQIPLLLMCFRDIGEELLKWFIAAYRHYGHFPAASLMKADPPQVFRKQASLLGNVILADGFNKGYTAVNWEEALEIMIHALETPRGKAYRDDIGLAPSVTHNLDFSYGYYCAHVVAKGLGRNALAADLLSQSRHWKAVVDSSDGLLREIPKEQRFATDDYPLQWFNFYEGNRWTYSFRVWNDMAGLIEHVGRERFLTNLDSFFGLDSGSGPAHFQGLNNEPDYCAPWAYYYAGCPSRAQQVVRTALLYKFSPGRSGLPGNDDSGALSSWFVWCAMGLFPIAGQDVFLISSPLFPTARLNLEGGSFTIHAEGAMPETAFVKAAILNGRELDRLYLHHDEIAKGGALKLILSDTPSDFGASNPPPSHPGSV